MIVCFHGTVKKLSINCFGAQKNEKAACFYSRIPIPEKEQIPDWKNDAGFRRGLSLLEEHVMVPEDREAFEKAMARETVLDKLSTEQAFYVRFRGVINGERSSYEFKLAADRDANGQIVGIIVGLYRHGEAE